MTPSGPRWLLGAMLFAGALLASSVALRRTLDPFDEGLLLQAAARMAAGEWPYADFGWSYGPGHPLAGALAFEVFGPNVVWWRVLRAVCDGAVAVLVWWLAREQAPVASRPWAPAAGVAALLTMAAPTTANPFPVALALGLGALACACRDRGVAAGLLCALAAGWRPDFGIYAFVAVLVAMGVRRAAARAFVAAALGVVAILLPFALVAGPGDLWDSLVATSLRDGAAWRLPFPLLYDGSLRLWPPSDLLRDGKDALGFQLPLGGLTALLLALVAVVAGRRRPAPATAGLLVLAAGGAAYFAGRADDLHQQPLLVVACALAAGLAPHAARALRGAFGAVVALVALAGAANLASALLLPPPGVPLHLPGVPGIRVAPAEAAALPALVADVQRRVLPGEPIYVAPRRSDVVTLTNPLVHTLVRRPNVLDRDAQVLNDPAEQAEVVTVLRARPPRVVVRWTDPLSARPEPNARGRPSGATALDDFLREDYALAARHGAYDVLVLRARTAG